MHPCRRYTVVLKPYGMIRKEHTNIVQHQPKELIRELRINADEQHSCWAVFQSREIDPTEME